MIVRGGAGLTLMFRTFLLRNTLVILLILSVEIVIGELNLLVPGFNTSVYSANAVAMLATVVGIFLVFLFNNAYQRWWEARILWGQLVNTSRNFGRQVNTLLTPERLGFEASEDELSAIRQRLIYRHLGHINALRLKLRGQNDFQELDPFLDEEEKAAVREEINPPLYLLDRQLKQVESLAGSGTAATLLLTHIDTTINLLTDIQGGCERIKNTIFPSMVRAMSTVFVWGMATLIPIVFLEPDQRIHLVEFSAVYFICMAFIVVKQLGLSLMDPFENKDNDIPMTALCRTIERDLRRQLGEKQLPEEIRPHNGILL